MTSGQRSNFKSINSIRRVRFFIKLNANIRFVVVVVFKSLSEIVEVHSFRFSSRFATSKKKDFVCLFVSYVQYVTRGIVVVEF